MGLLNRIFGKSQPSPAPRAGSSMSLAGSLMQQKETLAPGKCDVCGATYLSSAAQVYIFSVRAPEMSLDIGGYCPRCRKALCQRHLSYDRVLPRHLPDPQTLKDSSYSVVCEACGTQVRHDRNAEPATSVTIIALDAKDLEPRRPKPSPQFASPSGKISLHKMVLANVKPADPDLEPVPSMICMKCFAFHPHPVPAPVFGFDAFKGKQQFEPEDFEIDIGGDCPTCGTICGKHIAMRKVTIEGKQYLALHCAVHNQRLT